MLLILNFSTLTFITTARTTMLFARLHSQMVCTQSEPAEIPQHMFVQILVQVGGDRKRRTSRTTLDTRARTHTRTFTCAHTHTHKHTHIHTHTHTCTSARMHATSVLFSPLILQKYCGPITWIAILLCGPYYLFACCFGCHPVRVTTCVQFSGQNSALNQKKY